MKIEFFLRFFFFFFPTCFILVIQIKNCDETLPNFIIKKKKAGLDQSLSKQIAKLKGGPPRGKGTTKN